MGSKQLGTEFRWSSPYHHEPLSSIKYASGSISVHSCEETVASKEQKLSDTSTSYTDLEAIFDSRNPSENSSRSPPTIYSGTSSPFPTTLCKCNGMPRLNAAESLLLKLHDSRNFEESPPSCVPDDGRDFLLPPTKHPIYDLEPLRRSKKVDNTNYMVFGPLPGSDGYKLPPMLRSGTGYESFRYVPRFGVYLGRRSDLNTSQSYGSGQTVCYEVKDSSRWTMGNYNRVLLLDRELSVGNRYIWDREGRESDG